MKFETDTPESREAGKAWARHYFNVIERGRKTTEFLDSLDGVPIPIGDGLVIVMDRKVKRDG